MKIKYIFIRFTLFTIIFIGVISISCAQDEIQPISENKNEVGGTVTLDHSLFYRPQFGLTYCRLIYKRNLLVFGNVLISQYNRNDERARNRLYEIGLEYRWYPSNKLPLILGAQAGFMNSNWLYDRVNSGKHNSVDNTHNYLLNFTPMITYGNRFKIALGFDIGYGKSIDYREYQIAGTPYTYNNSYWTGVISKGRHIKLSYSF